jgi:hypothetical protein
MSVRIAGAMHESNPVVLKVDGAKKFEKGK